MLHSSVLFQVLMCWAVVFWLPGCERGSSSDPGEATQARRSVRKSGAGALSAASPSQSVRFKDVAPSAGLRFTYRNGEEAGHFAILESLGGGAALFDHDLDGRLDLYLPGGGEFGTGDQVLGRAPGFFANRGGWQFADVTSFAGLGPAPTYTHGAAAADYDNDGFTDVLVTGYGGLLLFHNRGDGTFAEVAAAARLGDELWSSSAAWGDFDSDGQLDVYVAHYVDWSFENHPLCPGPGGHREVCPPRQFQPLSDVLYLSNGDGTFRDHSRTAGLVVDGDATGKGLGVVAADVDLDGDLDVYVGNDTVPNFLYRNLGDARFEDASLMSGTSLSDKGVPDGSMGVDVGDFNLDGRPDIWVANYERESFALYRNEGSCFFQHVSQSTGITAAGGLYVGWGTVLFDADRDGDEDIFSSNGHVIRHPANAPLRQKPLLFENLAGKRFVNAAPRAGDYLDSPHMGRGVAVGDLDDDGRLDLAVSHTNEPVAVLRNESTGSNHWIGLRLIGTRSNRDAIGAIIRLHTAGGTQLRQVKGGGSYASTSDRRVHFGIGDQPRVERATIRWPSGHEQTITAPEIDRYHTIIEPAQPVSAN